MNNFSLLPFNFEKFDNYVVLTNDIGDYYFLSHSDFEGILSQALPDENLRQNLISQGFIYDKFLSQTIDNLADRYRSKKSFMYYFTSLHMFVLTYRCNHDCIYCHASSVAEDDSSTPDMSVVIARKCVDFALKSPDNNLKFEFQGGEPLLNFEALKVIVQYTRERLESMDGKKVEFVLCTNLSLLTDEQAGYLKDNDIVVSTSLDGPSEIHDRNRYLRNGKSSYDAFRNKIGLLESVGARDKVSALLTVTRNNLSHLTEVIDEYVESGFNGIFIRRLNCFGYAYSRWEDVGYSVEEFLAAYRLALTYIIDINKNGAFFQEIFATILLTKIMTPFSTGFVDLQSPAGVGISGVIYDTNGDVYVSDEARMFARVTGDDTFKIGNVSQNSYRDIICSGKLRDIVSKTIIEALPECCHCAFQPYCGIDPVKNYAANGEIDDSLSDTCRKHMGMFEIIFDYLHDNDRQVMDVFWSWVTGKKIQG